MEMMLKTNIKIHDRMNKEVIWQFQKEKLQAKDSLRKEKEELDAEQEDNLSEGEGKNLNAA